MKYEPRPYLVIPKLIEQPTWGGGYIADTKGWTVRDRLADVRIGQSYELFSGSNLSLLDSSDDLNFRGELTNSVDVETPTSIPGAIALADLVASAPIDVLGKAVVDERGEKLELLIKLTQALGNSFQVHIKAGLRHPKWKPKPEAWYYFEPGYITLGVKPSTDWAAYEAATRAVEWEMKNLSAQVKDGRLDPGKAKEAAQVVSEKYDPWQYVNVVTVNKNELVDLSAGGIHHSWEEDPQMAPLGNVLLELQAEAMDSISTFRSFDKGKIGSDGAVRDVHVDEYFEAIDRSPEANDPSRHIGTPELVHETPDFTYEHLLDSPYYRMDKLTFKREGGVFQERPGRYKHLYVKNGRIAVVASEHGVVVGAGHSCFLPANVSSLRVDSLTDDAELLVSY